MRRAATVVLAIGLFAAVAAPSSLGDGSAPQPTLASNSATYLPGGTVSLSGSGWLPGTMVTIRVDDNAGNSWSRQVDVLASADGSISDTFALPTSFASGFGAVATGQLGESATTSFTTAFAATSAPPTLVSDQPDYTPGSRVVLTGASWQPGESVRIVVNDDQGQTWSRSVDIVAAADGTIRDEFTLPDSFVARYTATATGASGTATTTFTDGNVKFDVMPTGATAQFTETLYSAATNCSGAVKSGFPKTVNASNGDNVGVGNNESIRIDAAATSDQGGAFQAWSSTDSPASPFTVITGTGGKSICVPGFQSGTRNYRATYGNAAPVINRDNASVTVNEGSAAANTGTWSDANAGDTVTLSASIGSVVKSGTNAGGTWTWSYTPSDGINPAVPQTVTITANDGTTTSSTTFTLTVNNVAPTATFNTPASVNEGSSINISLTSPSDPSSTDTAAGFTYAFDCGSGYGSFSGTSSTSCATTDNGSRTVKGKIKDKDGGETEYTASVTINNVAPTATFNAPASVDEGSDINLSLTSPSDPSSADTSAGFSYAFDCGSGYGSFSGTSTASCSSNDDGARTVKGKIKDKDGGETEYTASVTINNVAPTATFNAPASVNEGANINLSLTSPSDPSSVDTTAGFSYAFDCGTGSGYGAFGTSNTASCATTDNGSRTVKGKIKDKDGGTTEYSADVQIKNVAPTVTLDPTNTLTWPESQTAERLFKYTATDPAGTADPLTITIDCGSGGVYVIGSDTGSSFKCRFPDGPKSPKVKVSADDGDGGAGSATQDVTVNNVAPTVTLDPTNTLTFDESQTAERLFKYTASDPAGAADPLSITIDCGSGGNYVGGSDTGSSFKCRFPDGPATPQVKVTADDGDGDSGFATQNVAVKNVAPTVTLDPTNTLAFNESQSTGRLFKYTATDPAGADDPLTITIDCGTGGNYVGGSDNGSSFKCTFDDGPATPKVKVTANDGDGGITSDAQDVTVNNVDPTAKLGNDGPVNEGSPATISFSDQLDPSSADTGAGFHYAYACDGASLAGATYAGSGTGDTKQCTFADGPSTHTVLARIIDKDGGFTEYTTDVVVKNVAPTAKLGNNGPVNEGSSATISFSDQLDPSSTDTAAGFHYAYRCDGSDFPTDPTYAGTAGSTASKSCPFDDGTQDYTVRARIIDKDDGSTEYTTKVTVNNVAPTATFNAPASVDEGSNINLSLTSPSDPSSADTAAGFTYAFDCGSGYGSFSTTSTASCSTNDNGTRTVKGKIKDKDGGFTEYTAEVTIKNVAPTAALGDDGPVNEGSAATITFSGQFDPSSADTSAGFHYAYRCNGSAFPSDPSYSDGVAAASTQCTFDDGPSTHTVRARIIDKDGGQTEYTTVVTVKNVAPTATLSNDGPVGEAAPATISFSGQLDPSSADTAAGFHYAFACDNGSLAAADYAGSGTGASTSCTFDDGPSSHTVRARIIDKDGGYTEYTTVVVVENVAPTATLSNNGPVNEGGSATIKFTSPSDPSSADTAAGFHYAFACDGGSLAGETYASSGTATSKTCAFDDGPKLSTVRARIIDKDGGFTEYTTDVDVNNVAPTATFNAPTPVNEGSSINLSLTAPSDPSAADTLAGFTYAFDCGSGYDAFAPFNTASCPTTDNGTRTVKGKIQDKDGGVTEYAAVVTINNVDPTATLSNNGAVDEGSPATISFSGQSDPSTADTNEGFHYAFACDNGSLAGATYSGSDSTASTQCTFGDGPSTPSVRARIIDKDGGYSEYQTTVEVKNVAPKVSPPTDATADEGATKDFGLGSFTDPGDDSPWKVHVTWGDGSPATDFDKPAAGALGLANHAYDDNGIYTVTVEVTDDDGAVGSDSFKVTVKNVAPSATFNAPASVNEGSNINLSLTAPSDPSSADTAAGFSYAFDCGSGYGAYGSSNSTSCATTDNGSRDVKGKIKDKDGGETEYSASVTINNVAPTATLTNSGPINEGGSATVTFSAASDPSTDDTSAGFHYAYRCDGTAFPTDPTYAGTAASTNSQSCPFDDNGTFAVRARIIDKDGGYTEYTTNVKVDNVNPTATLGNNGPVNEGSPATISFSGPSDPSSADTAAGFHYAFACDDSSLAGATYTGSGTVASTQCTFADGPSTPNVRSRIIDKDGGYSEYETTVEVKNVKPSVSPPADDEADEGTSKSFGLGSFTDPGTDNPWKVHVTWGDGSAAYEFNAGSPGALGLAPHAYADNGIYPVTVKVTDDDGEYDTQSFKFTVKNVAPTATFNAPASVNEGSNINLSLTAPNDPSSVDTTAGFSYAFDCGSGYGAYGSSTSASCATTDNGSRTVKGKIEDKDGGVTEYTKNVTVNNVAPTATLGNNGPIGEGTSATVTFTAPSDPSTADTSAGFHYAFACDNGSLAGATYAGSGASASTTCPFKDNGAYTVRGRIIDKDGGSTDYTTAVTVTNAKPVITSITTPGTLVFALNNGPSITASFTDAGTLDTHTCSINWDDTSTSSGTVSESNGSGTCTASHTYTVSGVYTINVTVTDKDGGFDTKDAPFLIVVYDPSGGFVTGGGWINSPTGAYVANPSLTGRANFGFVSKYQKGATVPTGQTEFQFQVGNLNFHSENYQWLVVSGAKAQYKGTGTINGSGNYGFLLTATDGDLAGGGGVDKFRIKIWDVATGATVYDNVPGTADDIDKANPQVIAGGSISIKK